METKVMQVPPKDEYCDGTWVKMGGRKEYLIPALSFHALRKSQGALAVLNSITGIPTEEQIGGMIDLTYLALARNYPDMTKDEVAELIDLGNFVMVFQSLAKVSGLEPRKPGEEEAAS